MQSTVVAAAPPYAEEDLAPAAVKAAVAAAEGDAVGDAAADAAVVVADA
jgi:hypothetical protein